MITLRFTADIKDDRRVILTLPSEVPTGRAELEVTVERRVAVPEVLPAALPDWVEAKAEGEGRVENRYPLRGSVIRYEQPTEPVAEGDWETLR